VIGEVRYSEDEYEFEGGSTLLVSNDDPFMHDFKVAELDISEQTNPGSSVLVEIPDEPGDYIFYCSLHTFDPDSPEGEDMAARFSIA
jgi:hypothetical protein